MTDLGPEYLAGIFDGEGTVPRPAKKNARYVAIANTDLNLLEACRDICDDLGIRCVIGGPYACKPPRKQIWVLRISGRANLQKFLDLIPFRSAHKRENLVGLLGEYRQNYVRAPDIPVADLKRLHQEGLTQKAAASILKVDQGTISKWTQKVGYSWTRS